MKDEEVAVLDGVYVEPGEGQQILIGWRNILRNLTVGDTTRADDLATLLRRVRISSNAALGKQFRNGWKG